MIQPSNNVGRFIRIDFSIFHLFMFLTMCPFNIHFLAINLTKRNIRGLNFEQMLPVTLRNAITLI